MFMYMTPLLMSILIQIWLLLGVNIYCDGYV